MIKLMITKQISGPVMNCSEISVLVDLTTKSAKKLVAEPGLCSQFSICLFQLSLHCVRLERVETVVGQACQRVEL